MDNKHAAGYDFVKLGEGLTSSLLRAAQEQVTKAQAILDQTQSLTDIIMTQVRAQAQQIEDMNGRFKAFGEQMLDAHRKLNGDLPASVEPAPVSSIDRLRALDAVRHGRNGEASSPDPTVASGPRRDPDANYPARQSGLPWPVADIERFRVNRTDPGTDHHDQAAGPARS